MMSITRWTAPVSGNTLASISTASWWWSTNTTTPALEVTILTVRKLVVGHVVFLARSLVAFSSETFLTLGWPMPLISRRPTTHALKAGLPEKPIRIPNAQLITFTSISEKSRASARNERRPNRKGKSAYS